MTNEVIKKMLQDGYNEVAYTNNYIMGYAMDHVIFFTICGHEIVNRVTCIDKASRGQGYALRFKPNKSQKMVLVMENATALCSEEYFNHMVVTTKYNRGEIFEKLVTEYMGQTWEKDNVPFTKDGDITIDNVAYQIKFEKATFTNEKALANLKK